MADTFDVVTGNTSARYTNAQEAGAAYFKADARQRPSVIHTPGGGGARVLADTLVQGAQQGGQPSFVKSLPEPESHAVSPDFRHGYFEAERSVAERDTVNSIGPGDHLEPAPASPVRVGQAPRPAQAAELMRLYVKDENRYVLHKEADFQAVMEEAAVVYGAGKDVLVNEKANPQVVHAKSNLYHDVDVGREIAPVEKGGIFTKGKGEVLLDSFYAKLPLVDRLPVDRAQPESRQPILPTAEPAPRAPGKAEPEISVPTLPKAAPVVLEKDDADAGTDQDSDQKPILKKTGYALPAHVADAYTVKSGRFVDKGTAKVHFEDHGKKLSTSLEDRTVIKHMVDVAVAKNWGHLELTGTQSFRQMAWLEAEGRGIRTKGYEPTQQDLQQLAQAKNERGVSDPAAAKNEMVVSTERLVDAKDVLATGVPRDTPAAGRVRAGTDAERPAPATARAERSERSDPDAERSASGTQAAGPEVVHARAVSVDKNGPIVGRLVAHGRDNFNHDPDEKPSYFVALQTPAGERKVWGKDLERSMAGGPYQPGDAISLERQGHEDVTVDANVRGADGKVVGKEEIAARRNVWDVKPAGLVVMRDLSKEERVKVEAAYKVLDQQVEQYPTDVRREIITRFTQAVEKGELDLPTPQVEEKTAQPEHGREPAPEPELERAD